MVCDVTSLDRTVFYPHFSIGFGIIQCEIETLLDKFYVIFYVVVGMLKYIFGNF